MSELINRKYIKYHTILEPRGDGQYVEVEVAYRDDIEILPTIKCEYGCEIYRRSPDVEPITDEMVIRCKHCRFYGDSVIGWCYWRNEHTNADDFCSKGERGR